LEVQEEQHWCPGVGIVIGGGGGVDIRKLRGKDKEWEKVKPWEKKREPVRGRPHRVAGQKTTGQGLVFCMGGINERGGGKINKGAKLRNQQKIPEKKWALVGGKK